MQTENIADLYLRLPDQGLAARQMDELVHHAQQIEFFHLVAAKDARVSRLRQHFAATPVAAIYLSANLEALDFQHPGIPTAVLEKDFFHKDSAAPIEQRVKRLENTIVIINNNDAAPKASLEGYVEVFRRSENTIFVAWDWDNHHWLSLSCFFAAHSDVYGPSHYDNLFLLSRYNWLTVGPVHCASVQWSRRYLTEKLPMMTTIARSDEPLGRHIRYAKFPFRNQVITTVNQKCPSVNLTDHTYHGRTIEDRLTEWSSHKSHWIVPVLNDIPIRVFDALMCGGVPIVPATMRFLPVLDAIAPEHIEFYGPNDIMNPQDVIARANLKFDQGGVDGLIARHRFALDNHHGHTRIEQLLGYVSRIVDLGTKLGGRENEHA